MRDDRDVRAIELPKWGQVVADEGVSPWLVVDPDGVPAQPIARFLREFVAAGMSVASFYLPADYADRLDTPLPAAAWDHHVELLDTARQRVPAELPDATRAAQVLHMMGVVAEMGVPFKAYKLPAETVARLAIDRWARRSPATVVAATSVPALYPFGQAVGLEEKTAARLPGYERPLTHDRVIPTDPASGGSKL